MASAILSLSTFSASISLAMRNHDASTSFSVAPVRSLAFNRGQCRVISRRLSSVTVKCDAGTTGYNFAKIEGNLHGDPSMIEQVAYVFPKVHERDFANTLYIPVYVMLPLGTINMDCELVDPDNLIEQLKILKSTGVDGVLVNCWWGIVERHSSEQYNWRGYKRLFQIVRDLKLKLHVVLSFHECGGNVVDDVHIPLPQWVLDIGRTNPDIYFTDRAGNRNHECLTWGIDEERVLRDRLAVEVYYDYMRRFRVEFDEFFKEEVISKIEIGLGPCGELRYPSYPAKNGWEYPGIGEFQCYDKYLMNSLKKAAKAKGHSSWGRVPDNVGSYNSKPQETEFFCDQGDFCSSYGTFFLKWYTNVLVDHGDRVLFWANLTFKDTPIAAKLSGIHWWYESDSRAAELTAGFYNRAPRNGYLPVALMLKKHEAALNFSRAKLGKLENFPEALAEANPKALLWQVLNTAWDVGVPIACENDLPWYDTKGYYKILEKAIMPSNNPDGRRISAFYTRLSPSLMEGPNLLELKQLVKFMHGEAETEFQA